jgi:hypothetical protein
MRFFADPFWREPKPTEMVFTVALVEEERKGEWKRRPFFSLGSPHIDESSVTVTLAHLP